MLEVRYQAADSFSQNSAGPESILAGEYGGEIACERYPAEVSLRPPYSTEIFSVRS